jgi:hypothetical protein
MTAAMCRWVASYSGPSASFPIGISDNFISALLPVTDKQRWRRSRNFGSGSRGILPLHRAEPLKRHVTPKQADESWEDGDETCDLF